MFLRIFNSKSRTVTFAAFLLGISVLASRFLGLVRDRLLAGHFGATRDLDIYFAAFRVPDFVYGILIMGGISAVFLPIFSEYFKKEDQKKAWQFANNLLNCFLILLIFICAILAIFTPWIIELIAPGFSLEDKKEAIALTRIMFLSPIIFGISSIFSGVLHYFDRFLAYSIAPVLYNLGIIFGIVYFFPIFGLYGLAYGVILGAFLHLLIQIPAAINCGYKYLPLLNFRNFGLIKVFRLMIPRTIGAAAYHVNLIVITAIASTLAAGSITIFNFANNLQYFPIGLIGVSFSIAAFPALSRAWASGLKEDFFNVFSSAFRQILFLIVPISFLIFILRAHIVRLVLGTGEFGWFETQMTAASLGIFAISIFAVSFISFLARVFYSFQDTKTPVLISLASMGLNVGLCFLFVYLLAGENYFHYFISGILKLEKIHDIRLIGLPLALSISGIFQFFLLLFFLKKKMDIFKINEILDSAFKVLTASFLMVVLSYTSLFFLAGFLKTDTFVGLFLQAGSSFLVGAVVYFSVSYYLKSSELQIISSSIYNQLISRFFRK